MVRSNPGSGAAWALKSDLDDFGQTLPAIVQGLHFCED